MNRGVDVLAIVIVESNFHQRSVARVRIFLRLLKSIKNRVPFRGRVIATFSLPIFVTLGNGRALKSTEIAVPEAGRRSFSRRLQKDYEYR